MKILFNQSKITILISVILLATINVGSSNKSNNFCTCIYVLYNGFKIKMIFCSIAPSLCYPLNNGLTTFKKKKSVFLLYCIPRKTWRVKD